MEINIIDIGTIPELSREEKAIQIEKITNKFTRDLTRILIELNEESAEIDARMIKPEMEEFLLRKILDYDAVSAKIGKGKIIELKYPKMIHEKGYIKQFAKREPFNFGELVLDHSVGSLSGDIKHNEMFITYYPWNPSMESRLSAGFYDSFYLSQMKLLEGKSLNFENLSKVDVFDYLKYVYKYHNSVVPYIIHKYIPEEIPDIINLAVPIENKLDKKLAEFLQLFSNSKIESYIDVAREGLQDIYDDKIMGEEIRYDKRIIDLQTQLNNIEDKKKELKESNKISLKKWLYYKNFGKVDLENATKEEKDLIETAYERYINFWEAFENNDCPHVKLLNHFHKHRTPKNYKELRQFFGEEKGFIECNLCKFDTICAHVKDAMEATVNRKNVRSALTKYISKVPVFGKYYCRICGEELFDSDEKFGLTKFMGGKRVVFQDVDDELRTLTWKTTNQILRSFVAFHMMPDRIIANLISVISDTILGNIRTIEEKLIKSKTDTRETTKDKLKAFINIYVYAMLIRIIKEDNGVSFTAPKDIRLSGKKDVKSLFIDAYKILSNSRSSLFARIPELTDDSIKTYLFNAYKELTGSIEIKDEYSILETNLQLLYLDPFYHWLLKVHQSLFKGKPKNAPKLSDTKLLIGKKEELEKETALYDSIKLPDLEIVKDPKNLVDMKHNIIMKSFVNIVEGRYDYVPDKIYLDLGGFLAMRRYNFQSEFLRLPELSGMLPLIYGKGHKHKWDIFVYDHKDIKVGDIEGDLSDHYIKDRKCSICGKLYSNPGKEIRKDLIKQNEIETFYIEYETLCPIQKDIDYYHNWKNGKCKKCGLTREMAADKDEKYFDKYHKTVKEKIEEVKIVKKKLVEDNSWKVFADKWKYIAGVATQLSIIFAKHSDLDKTAAYNIVNSLGATEGYYFNEIKQGKESETEVNVKEAKLNEYIQFLLQKYGLLSQHNKLRKTDELKDMVEKILETKQVKLPEIGKGYMGKYSAIKESGKNVNDFLLMYLTELLNELPEQIKTKMTEYFVDHVIKSEEQFALLSKAREVKLMQARRPDIAQGDAIEYESEEDDIDEEYGSRFEYFDIDYDGANDEDNKIFDM